MLLSLFEIRLHQFGRDIKPVDELINMCMLFIWYVFKCYGYILFGNFFMISTATKHHLNCSWKVSPNWSIVKLFEGTFHLEVYSFRGAACIVLIR